MNRDEFIDDLYDVTTMLLREDGREFDLYRHVDPTNISGLGAVASGIQLSRAVVMQWRDPHPSKVIWPTIDEVLAVHGHGGLSQIRWS